MPSMNPRSAKALRIVREKRVDCNEEGYYSVRSDSSGKVYDVIAMESGIHCSCPDHKFRDIACKHILAVQAIGKNDNVLAINV